MPVQRPSFIDQEALAALWPAPRPFFERRSSSTRDLPRSPSNPIDLFVGPSRANIRENYFAKAYADKIRRLNRMAVEFQDRAHGQLTVLIKIEQQLHKIPAHPISMEAVLRLTLQCSAIKTQLSDLRDEEDTIFRQAMRAIRQLDALALGSTYDGAVAFYQAANTSMYDWSSAAQGIFQQVQLVQKDFSYLPPAHTLPKLELTQKQQEEAFCIFAQGPCDFTKDYVAYVEDKTLHLFDREALEEWLSINPRRNVIVGAFLSPIDRQWREFKDLRQVVVPMGLTSC